MSDEKITYVMELLRPDDKIEEPKDSFYETVRKAYHQALQEGIEANSIVINENMVKVEEFPMRTLIGGAVIMPKMICGLNVYLTKDELPNNYSFAVVQGPNTMEERLQKFEEIGMEPSELKLAAELYRKAKECVGI